jgi:splicing factor 3A subunit 1
MVILSGVIRPPPEIRAVADRTALYVAKNGRAFEERILNSERGKTPKFGFLHRTSPFHAYYEDRIQFYENGGEDAKEGESSTTVPSDTTKEGIKNEAKENDEISQQMKRKQEQSKKASVIDPVAKALLSQRSKINQFRNLQENSTQQNTNEDSKDESYLPATQTVVTIPPPPPFHFINIAAPASLSPPQIESIQLVAQFVALDGKGGSFLPQMTYREWNNPEFAFCQPRHGHFPYFSALVDAYRRIVSIWTSSDSIKNNSMDQVRLMANNIDYCLDAAAYRAEYELEKEREARKTDEYGISDGFGKIDWHDFVVVETIDFAADEVVEQAMLPPPPPPLSTTSNYNEDDMMLDTGEDEEQIRVVPSYTPKIVATHETRVETVIDPITGKSVPVKDMPEHLRIQLLDPKWAEERKKFQEKQKDSNLVSGDVVASNLERFAQARGDRFGKKVSACFIIFSHIKILNSFLKQLYIIQGSGPCNS